MAYSSEFLSWKWKYQKGSTVSWKWKYQQGSTVSWKEIPARQYCQLEVEIPARQYCQLEVEIPERQYCHKVVTHVQILLIVGTDYYCHLSSSICLDQRYGGYDLWIDMYCLIGQCPTELTLIKSFVE
jgi:hypothetical protein